MYEVIQFPLTDKMTTGVTRVDDQHRQLLNLAANLVNSMGEQLSNEKVKENLDFLGDYVVVHFQDEELLQQESSYPGYIEHKKHHDELIITFTHLKTMYEKEGNSTVFQDELNNSILSWVMDHIRKEDQLFAMHYKLVKGIL